jgi:hypothetical protein
LQVHAHERSVMGKNDGSYSIPPWSAIVFWQRWMITAVAFVVILTSDGAQNSIPADLPGGDGNLSKPQLSVVIETVDSNGSEVVQTKHFKSNELSQLFAAAAKERVIQSPSVVERGPDFRVVQTVTTSQSPDGSTLYKTNQFKITGATLEGEGLLPGVQSFISQPPTLIASDADSKTFETVTQYIGEDDRVTSKRETFMEFTSDEALNAVLNRAPEVLERGGHHKVVHAQNPEGMEGRKLKLHPATYTELETGMAYQDDTGNWHDSVPEFEIVDGGAVARRTQHKVALGSSPTGDNPVDLTLPGGARLRSRVLGLGYFDRASGKSVVIADIQDSQGQLSAANDQVVYPGAFKNFSADLRYVLSKAGLEQDVILNEQPPAAEDYGLDSASSQLEVITEFFPEIAPEINSKVMRAETDAVKRTVMAEPDLIDDTVNFGSMQIGYGRAFGLWDQDENLKPGRGVTMSKRWQKVDGRTILFEAVPLLELKPLLEKLPPTQIGNRASKREALLKRVLPQISTAQVKQARKNIQVAKAVYPKTGLLLDYNLVGSTSSPFTFLSGTTYRVVGTATLSGGTTIQGGAIIKYAAGATLRIQNGFTCSTASAKAYLVAETDNSVGETIVTGAPVGTYASMAISLYSVYNNSTLSNVEIRNAATAVDIYAPSSQTVSDCKIVDSSTGVRAYFTAVTLQNVSVCNVATSTLNMGSSSFTGSPSGANCAFCAGDDFGNTIPSATTLTIGSSIAGAFNCGGDEDFFTFTLGSTTTLNIYTTGTTDTYGHLLNSAGQELAADDSSGSASNFSINQTLGAGTYYLRVRHAYGGTGSYQVQAVSVSGWTPLVYRVGSFGSIRNEFTGSVGFEFVVGSSPLSVKELGRWVVPGNSGSHLVSLLNADGSAVPNGSVTVYTAGRPPGFAYSALPTPVTLAAGATYVLMSQEAGGGDQWYDNVGTAVSLNSGASGPWATWASPGSGYVGAYNGNGVSYVPVNLTYAFAPANTVPTISYSSGNQTINEDTSTATLPVTIGDAETAATSLTLTAASSNPTIIPVGNIVLGGSGTARNVTVYPGANQNGGPVTITLTVSDNNLTASTSFTVTVNPVNDRPTFNAGGNVTVNEDSAYSGSWAGGLSAGPADESGQTLTFMVSGNTNPGLFSVGPAINSFGTLSFTPTANANGSANITVYLQDSGGTANGGLNVSSPSVTFTITVNAVNDPPSFVSGGNVTVDADSGPHTIPWATSISAGPANEAGQVVTFFTPGNSNPGLFSTQPSISSSGVLSFTSAPNASGSSTITAYLQDDGGTANGGVNSTSSSTFVIAVNSHAQQPVLTSSFNSDHSSDTVTGASNGQVHYTINGLDPDINSSTTPPSFSVPTTVKARAYGSGLAPSYVSALTVGTTLSVAFSPNGHGPTDYSNGPLPVQMSAESGATVYYKAGATGSWFSTTSGSSPSIDGIDSGNGTIQAYAYTADKLRSATTTSAEFSFRLPQPVAIASYPSYTSGSLTLSDAVAGASIYYTTNGTIPTVSASQYSAPLTNAVSTRFYAKAFKSGYIPSGYVSAWINRLPAAKLATSTGLLTTDSTVSNSLDIWLVPNFGFTNVYGEELNANGWGSVTSWTNDVPNVNYPGAFVGAANSLVNTANYIGVTPGHTYSMSGWYKSFNVPGQVYGGVVNYDNQPAMILPQHVNAGGFSVTYLTQALSSGSTTAYVQNEQIFTYSDPTWYFHLFAPLTNFSRTTEILKGNQANLLKDICQIIVMDQNTSPYITNISAAAHSLTFAHPYTGPTLPIGTAVTLRLAGSTYQYDLIAGVNTPASWTKYSNSFSYLRPGTEQVQMHSLLSRNGTTSAVTGMELWEGSQAQRPNLYYTLNGSTAVYTQTPVAGPVKITLDGNTQGTINLGQRGAYYIDAPVLQRIITFKVGTPQIVATLNSTGTQVTNVATTATMGAQIYYTTDGSDPTTSSSLYNSNTPPSLTATVTTKWKAFKTNYTPSDTVTALGVPVFSPGSGTVPLGQNVTITAPAGAQLKVFQPNPNLLDPSTWVLGSQGSQTGFNRNGDTAENVIETRRTPYGTAEKVWVGYNLDTFSGEPGQDGGWNSDSFPVDKTKLYRFSVWLRKLDTTPVSTSGSSYLGCGGSTVSTLTGTSTDSVNSNPYFWAGALPLNDWYLLVGYVHPAGDLTTTHSSKMYNTAGQVVSNGSDFRWLPSTTTSYHRSYLYYCTEAGIQQEFWNPRVEVVTSVNDPIDILFATPETSPKTIALNTVGTKTIQALSYSASSSSGVVSSTYVVPTDYDNDGLPDSWELQYFGNLTHTASVDEDGDGLTNSEEYNLSLDPTKVDTDGNGVNDGDEDFDHDLLSNICELRKYNTDPKNPYSGGGTLLDSHRKIMAIQSKPTDITLSISFVQTPPTVQLTLTPTIPGQPYLILRDKNLGPWSIQQQFFGAQNQTSTTISFSAPTEVGAIFAWVGGLGSDSDGDGLPDAYEVYVTHTSPDVAYTSGTSDWLADPDGDGWLNMIEMQNGTNPLVPDPPQAPTLSVSAGTSDPILSWTASPGAPTGYTIERRILGTSDEFITINQTAPNVTQYTDTGAGLGFYEYAVIANSAAGASLASNPSADTDTYIIDARVIREAGGKLVLQTAGVPADVFSLLIDTYPGTATLPIFNVSNPNESWLPNEGPFNTLTIPVASLSSGRYEFSAADFPPYTDGTIVVRGLKANGRTSIDPGYSITWSRDDAPFMQPREAGATSESALIPFVDGRRYLKDNLNFRLQMADSLSSGTQNELSLEIVDPTDGSTQYLESDPGYAFANFTTYLPASFEGADALFLNELQPISENYLLRNLQSPLPMTANNEFVDAAHLDIQPIDSGNYQANYVLNLPLNYSFDQTQLGAATHQLSSVASILHWKPAAWGSGEILGDMGMVALTGVNAGKWQLQSGAKNAFGLPYISVSCWSWDGVNTYSRATVTPGQSIRPLDGDCFFTVTAPELNVAGYYFTHSQPIPSDPAFSTSLTSETLIAERGKPFFIAGWAKNTIANGTPGKYAYLQQYFSGAFLADANGNPTSTSAGTISEYGDFLPTLPGKVIVKTMPDIDVPTQSGQATVYVVGLSVDANHDEVMDTSFGGTDTTSADRPFRFWVNNDSDSTYNPADSTSYEGNGFIDALDPVIANSIYSARDLEDFARLWINGLPTLPQGGGQTWQVRLNWENEQGPAIRLYYAADHDITGKRDGGDRYWKDSTAAADQQVGYLATQWSTSSPGLSLGLIGPNQALNLPLSLFNDGQSQYFLFTAKAAGKGNLVLSILKDNVPVASTTVSMDIRDIRDMYEAAAIVGASENPNENSVSSFIVTRPLQENADQSNEMIVFIHGYNMTQWDYENFSATMYKRLYWQGYPGRFASVKWRTPSKDTFQNDPGSLYTSRSFNIGEFVALRSGKGLAEYFKALRGRYPDDRIGVCSHSTGAQVVAEALRNLAAEGQRPVNNYVIMQGALPAQSYDPRAVLHDASLDNTQNTSPTPNTHDNYAGGISGGLTGNIVNFFNKNDWVLQTGTLFSGQLEASWYVNQRDAKPDNRDVIVPFLGLRKTTTPRDYRSNASVGWEEFQGSTITRTLTNPHELIAFVARSRTRAVGAKDGVLGAIQSEVDLGLPLQNGGIVEFAGGRNEHSGEFNWNIQRTTGFYNALLLEMRRPKIQ